MLVIQIYIFIHEYVVLDIYYLGFNVHFHSYIDSKKVKKNFLFWAVSFYKLLLLSIVITITILTIAILLYIY